MKELYTMGIIGKLVGEGTSSGAVVAFTVLGIFLSALIGYLMGGINTAIIYSKLVYRDDIRKYGSGNAGMTNMLRTYGKKAAVLTLLGDLAKSAVAVIIARFIGVPLVSSFVMTSTGNVVSFTGYVAALFAVLGHTFPVYYGFRGGKGVAAAAAAMLVLNPIVCAICLLVFVFTVWGTKFVSLGSILAAMCFPVFMNSINGSSAANIVALLIAVLIVFNHRENLARLSKGKENKISFGKKKDK